MASCTICPDVSISVYKTRGKTVRCTIEIKTDVVDISDLTDSEIWFTVKSQESDVDNLIQKKTANIGGADDQVKVTDGPAGKIEIYLAAADTINMVAGEYKYDVAIKLDGSAEPLEAISPSIFEVKQPIGVI